VAEAEDFDVADAGGVKENKPINSINCSDLTNTGSESVFISLRISLCAKPRVRGVKVLDLMRWPTRASTPLGTFTCRAEEDETYLSKMRLSFKPR